MPTGLIGVRWRTSKWGERQIGTTRRVITATGLPSEKDGGHWFRVLLVCQRSHGVASCNIAIRGAAPCSSQGCKGGISGPANVLCRAANLQMARATKADHRWLAHGHIRGGRQSVLCSPAFRQDNGRFHFSPIALASANHRSSTERFTGQAH